MNGQGMVNILTLSLTFVNSFEGLGKLHVATNMLTLEYFISKITL